ncbi:MAG: ABC transporter permease [Anaerolineae bacterium]|nr:ABC transporter permease [Anaerolineae bacterium]
MTTQTSSQPEAKTQRAAIPRWVTALAPVWTLVALVIFFGLSSQSFLRPQNINNILVQVSTLAIFGTGMTFVLLTGEIDLGISSTAAISGMVAAQLFATLKLQEPIPFLAGLLVGTLIGFLAGFISTRFRIPTFMATLATSFIGAGLTTFVSKGRTVTTLPEYARFLGSGRIFTDAEGKGGFPFIVIVAAFCLLTAYLILRYTRFGRYVYMTGASKSAARLAGVNTNMILIAVLTLCGFTAGLAGTVSMGRLGSAQPDPVPSYLLDTISAVVLGGTALTGGRGGIPQTLIGLLIYGTLRNGLDNMPNIDIYLKEFITGVVLIAALVVNVVFSGKSARDKTV